MLAAVGIFGVISYSVSQQTRKIGIRMALGAQASAVLAQVLKEGARIVAMGLALILAGITVAASYIRHDEPLALIHS